MRIPSLALLLMSSTSLAAVKNVSTVTQLQSALATAQAGDEIVLADGTYAVNANLNCAAEGTSSQPIRVRAANRHAALIRFNATEGFKVSGRYWVFDGLTIEGACAQDVNCEHAFHVTGHAENFVLRNSRVRDFNAQLKVNATPNSGGVYEMPHRGLIENNEVYDTRVRNTSTPVTKLNIDTGDDWVVRDNFIHDFSRAGGVAYGAFMKSGGKRGVFERNRVMCTTGAPASDTRIGLSFGGGGTGNAYCAPAFNKDVPCDPEHSDGILRNNVVINCSDVAIYLNKATNTKVLFNTLIATTGVDFRYASSTGEAHGNVLSGPIRSREGGTFTAGTNLPGVAQATWDSWYVAPLAGDLRVESNVTQLIGGAAARASVTDDHCARPRPSSGAYTLGALEHSLGDCGAGSPTDGGTPPDAGTGTAGDGGTGGGVDGGADAGTGSGLDAGNGEPLDGKGGCGCGSSPGLAAAFLSLLLPVMVRRRSRRPGDEG
jgi:hypothetical protein